tara:strand:- start:14 stop:1303 length:1290 start_codon:yes stop_codon:yes gene_type:complete
MTESTFIALHTLSGSNPLNQPGRLHLNVNRKYPNIPTNLTGVIENVIVHVTPNAINGITGSVNNIESVLEQVETIKFKHHNIDFTLNINTSAFYPVTYPFFYFRVDPVEIPDAEDNNIIGALGTTIEDVIFTPYLAGLIFEYSDANSLFSNATELRKSSLIMKSDRLENTVSPTNLEALIEETADRANIQDSLLFDTGWTRARYVGSKTTPADNSGIEPALSGRSFIGESFSKDTTTDYICKLDNRIQREYFHDGKTQLPKYSISDPHISELTSTLLGGGPTNDTESTAAGETTLLHLDLGVNKLYPGDIITLNPLTVVGSIEYMEVVTADSPTQTTVRRDIYRTRVASLIPPITQYQDYENETAIYKVDVYNIFTLDSSGQSRLNSVGSSRIYVEGTNEIIETDKDGVITSSSFCPVFNVDIVDGQSG